MIQRGTPLYATELKPGVVTRQFVEAKRTAKGKTSVIQRNPNTVTIGRRGWLRPTLTPMGKSNVRPGDSGEL